MPKLRVHIGHHFYGSGNLGDDLMLAGFLAAARPAFLEQAAFTCCSPHDPGCLRRRFPEIEWLPYDDAVRADSIARADVWLGLGDTPFQAMGGHTWFLDHLCREAAWCRQSGVPMCYLGVGVNERATADLPQTRLLVAQAERLWLRDEGSLGMLASLTRPGQATAHADLAHLALTGVGFPAPDPGSLGFVLNFEDPRQFRPDELAALVTGAAEEWRVRWLAQEVRPLAGSETCLHGLLPPEARALAPLLEPDYAGAASATALLTAWEGLDALFTSRYHAALVGAWMGARVAVFARNDKVAAAAGQLGLSIVPDVGDTAAVRRALREARPCEPARLRDLADRARAACEEFFALAGVAPRPRPAPAVRTTRFSRLPAPVFSQPPTRLLFLHPDAYGDLVLFEPVLRLVRAFWPEVEMAVLIRRPYEDVAGLIGSGGVRWLTTECNPYRESPGANPAALAALRETVGAFAPDCVVAACAEQTWLEAAVASFLPGARQISLGAGVTDPVQRAALDAALPVDWEAIYPEKIAVEPAAREWEKNLCLAGALLGREVPRWWPLARVPNPARERAAQIIAEAGLAAGSFAACGAAGSANVQIKSWPAEHYGDTLASLQRERGVRALLIGHASERERLETVRRRACEGGADPALWLGQDGEMPVLAGLLEAASFYLGNDTGALHLAAALSRPVAAIFGGGTWPRFRPVARRSAVVVQPLPCFGCGWKCYFGDAPCVREIPPDAVRRGLEWLLSSDEEAETEITVADAIPPKGVDLIRATTEAQRAHAGPHGGDPLSQRAVADLFKQLDFSETDRAARLAAIQTQGAEISRLHAEVDRQLKTAADFWPRLDAAVNERNLLAAQMDDLRGHFERSEADRNARGLLLETQGTELSRLHAEVDRWLREAGELRPQLEAARHESNLRAAQLADLRGHFERSEADRAARGQLLETQDAEINRLNAEADRWRNESNLRAAQLADLRGHFERSEADRAARLQLIETQGTELSRLHAEVDRWRNESNLRAAQFADLRGHFERSEADRAARLEVIISQGETVGRLQAQLAAGEAERARLAAEADRWRAAHGAVEAARGELQKTHDRLRTTHGEFRASHDALLSARGELQASQSALRQEHDALQTAHAALAGEYGAMRAQKKKRDRHWTSWLLKRLRLGPR